MNQRIIRASNHHPHTGLLAAIFIFVLGHFIVTTIDNNGALFSLETLRSALLPILLSIMSLPAYYLMHCYSKWQTATIRLGIKKFQSDELKSKAKQVFFRNFFLSPPLLDRAVRQFQSLPAKTNTDIHEIVSDIRAYVAQRKAPSLVSSEQGWCPFRAETFLDGVNLTTNDYHKSGFNDEWFAESRTINVLDSHPLYGIIYRIVGDRGAVKHLQIKAYLPISPSPTK